MADWNYDAMESGYSDNQGRIQGIIHADLRVAVENFREADQKYLKARYEWERAETARRRAEDEVIRLEQLLADLEKENN